MPNQPDLQSLVEDFTNQLTLLMRRAALEEVHAKLSLAIGDVSAPKRQVRRTGKRGRPGKFTPEQLEKHGASIVALLKKTPGARSEQLSAAMKMDAATLRIPLKALIKAKKIKVKGQKRGTTYFAR